MRFTAMLAALVAAMVISMPARAGVLDSLTVEVGAQGAWWDSPGGASCRRCDDGDNPGNSMRDVEAVGAAALGLTSRIAITGGIMYGFAQSYLRGSTGLRLTATDGFSLSLGAERHFRSEDGPMDEWAGTGAIGWRPVSTSDVVIRAGASFGFETSRRLIFAGAMIPLRIVVP